MALFSPSDEEGERVNRSATARSVSWYSTLGGLVGNTVGATKPSRSRSRNLWVSIRFAMLAACAGARRIEGRGLPGGVLLRQVGAAGQHEGSVAVT